MDLRACKVRRLSRPFPVEVIKHPEPARRLTASARLCLIGLVPLLAAALGSCASVPRLPPPGQWQAQAAPVGFPSDIRWDHDATQADFEKRALRLTARWQSVARERPLEILMLSGGGAGGAFGAGILVGWSQLGSRPDFDIVTGVSAGALIAPLAFLGSAWDGQLEEAFGGQASEGLLKPHWIDALFGTSVFDGAPLKHLVERFVTPELIRAVAAESARGRLLLVGTTDLDREKLVVWNMGLIAAQGGEAARELFSSILVASASVPGVFPPVMIHSRANGQNFDEMHADGGTRESFLAFPDIATVSPVDLPSLNGAHLYLLANRKLGSTTQNTAPDTRSILMRSVATALQGVARSNVVLVYAFARRHGITLQATAIPESYPYGGPLDFSASAIRQLFLFGQRCTLEGRAWDDALDVLDYAARGSAVPLEGSASCPNVSDALR